MMPFQNVARRSYSSGELPDVERQEIQDAESFLVLAKGVDSAFVTVGSPDTNFDRNEVALGLSEIRALYERLSAEEKRRCAGDLLLRLLDSRGQPIGNEDIRRANESFVYSIGLDDLKSVTHRGHVWVMAERKQKARIVDAVLKAGYANCVIGDTALAQTLLRI